MNKEVVKRFTTSFIKNERDKASEIVYDVRCRGGALQGDLPENDCPSFVIFYDKTQQSTGI